MVRSYRYAHVATLVCAMALGACQQDSPTGPEFSSDIQTFVGLVNEHRASVGCAPLTWISELATVAQEHSVDMAENDYFDHDTPTGLSPMDRLEAAGLHASRVAENIAWGYATPQQVLQGWLESPGHRANIENCALTEHGVGLYQTRWTHLFRTP
jgi:uncharacterized protein YkwD